ncbi:hypothetical protein Tco_0853024 [Tanacetum coccineum]
MKQVAETQHAKEPVATTDTTKSVDAFESVEVLGNWPKPADVDKVQEQIDEEVVKDFRIKSIGSVSFDELYRNDESRSADESPFDTELKIKFIKKKVPKTTIDKCWLLLIPEHCIGKY